MYIFDSPRGQLMIWFYRFAHIASVCRKKFWLHKVWANPILIFYRLLTEIIFGYEIPAACIIGKDLIIDHGYGIVINKHVVIGDNCRIKHNVTIGCKTMPDGGQGPSPVIGNFVDIGAGAIIIGEIIIGNNVQIGAGAIVTTNVPDNSVVRGQRAVVFSASQIIQ